MGYRGRVDRLQQQPVDAVATARGRVDRLQQQPVDAARLDSGINIQLQSMDR